LELWRPTTQGEAVFLHLHTQVASGVEIVHEPYGLHYLVHQDRYIEFARLTIAIELFLRALRTAIETYEQTPGVPPKDLGKRVRQETDLPDRVTGDRKFCEALRDAGRIAHERRRFKGLEDSVLRSEANWCYLCGTALVGSPGHHNTATVEHLWPLSLAGETVEGNLIPACKSCNDRKGHAITWAWGPVQSTYHEGIAGGTEPNHQLRVSLALARLMLVAAGPTNKLTLKQAAQKAQPLYSGVTFDRAGPRVFFEYFSKVEAMP
jgi:hypothetical protein